MARLRFAPGWVLARCMTFVTWSDAASGSPFAAVDSAFFLVPCNQSRGHQSILSAVPQGRTGILAFYQIGGFVFIDEAFDAAGERAVASRHVERQIWGNAVDLEMAASSPSLYLSLRFRGPYSLDMRVCDDLVRELTDKQRWHEVTVPHLLDRQASFASFSPLYDQPQTLACTRITTTMTSHTQLHSGTMRVVR